MNRKVSIIMWTFIGLVGLAVMINAFVDVSKQNKEITDALQELEVSIDKEREGAAADMEVLRKELDAANEQVTISNDAGTKMAEQLEMNAAELSKEQEKAKKLQAELDAQKEAYKKLEVSKAEERKAKEQKVVATNSKVAAATTQPSRGKKSEGGVTKYVEATAYTAFCNTGCIGITATGVDVSDSSKNYNIIAVDPSVIPLHSIVEIEGYGTFRALDTGGDIKGNRIDILVNNHDKAMKFGRQQLKIRIIRSGKG